MSTMLMIPAAQIQSPGVQNGPTTAAPNAKPGAAGDPADPNFGILLGQLLASVLQNGQQAPLDLSKLGVGTQPAGEPAVPPQAQPQAQPAAQQPVDLSKLLLGIQNQDKTTEEENATAQFADVLKNIKGNAEGRDLSPKTPEVRKGTSLDEDSQTVQSGPDGKNVFYLSDKYGKHDVSLLQNIGEASKQGENDKDGQKAEPTISGPAKTDFAAIVQQAQSSDQHAASHDATAQTANTGASPAAVRPHGVDSSDAFDHAVSIVKDGNRLAVQLDHNGLGKLDINLSLDKGAVSAQINVADDATKKMIENNMQQIVNSLLGDGVSVGGFSVSLRQQGTGDGSKQYQQDGARQSSSPVLPSVAATHTTTARSLVSIFI